MLFMVGVMGAFRGSFLFWKPMLRTTPTPMNATLLAASVAIAARLAVRAAEHRVVVVMVVSQQV